MKRFLILLLTTILLAGAVQARTFALLIGVSQNANPEMNLPGTAESAKKFGEVLSSHTKDISILTSKYANKENILSTLSAIANRAQKGDRIILYFSGHGGTGGLLTYDNRLTYDEIIAKLASSAATEKYCFIDACHAGSAANSHPNSTSAGEGNITFFVSCRPEENSQVSGLVGDVFTKAVLKGLQGKSDANSDKKITVIELFKYIYGDVVKRQTVQGDAMHPQLIGPKSMHNNVILNWK